MVGRPLDDRELVARAKRGDADAYEELVHAYQGIALRTAYLIAGNAADAEEAAQDGFVKAYRSLWRFRPGAPFKPWLLRIVANEARNRRRSAGRRAELALRAAGEAASGDAASSPEAALLGAERRQELLGDNDFRDPWGNHFQVVDYRDVQFTKKDRILRGMGLAGLEKRERALGELRAKGLAD